MQGGFLVCTAGIHVYASGYQHPHDFKTRSIHFKRSHKKRGSPNIWPQNKNIRAAIHVQYEADNVGLQMIYCSKDRCEILMVQIVLEVLIVIDQPFDD